MIRPHAMSEHRHLYSSWRRLVPQTSEYNTRRVHVQCVEAKCTTAAIVIIQIVIIIRDDGRLQKYHGSATTVQQQQLPEDKSSKLFERSSRHCARVSYYSKTYYIGNANRPGDEPREKLISRAPADPRTNRQHCRIVFGHTQHRHNTVYYC